MTLNKGDKVRIKRTKEIGEIIKAPTYVPMYYVDTGTRCVWVDDSEIEEVEDEVQGTET
jgi:hypothetical protein